MTEPIVLYDIPRKLRDGETEADMSWSPNVFKTRSVRSMPQSPCGMIDTLVLDSAALNIKGLPFKRVWVDFKDVADVLSKLGVEPHETGNLKYTCPTIYDPSTKRTVMDSQKIVSFF